MQQVVSTSVVDAEFEHDLFTLYERAQFFRL